MSCLAFMLMMLICSLVVASDGSLAQALGRLNKRDYYITLQDVVNISPKVEGLSWRYDNDQAESIRRFVECNPAYVLKPEEDSQEESDGSEPAEDQPFQLAFSTPELLTLLVKFGNKRALMLDSTFGTNNLKARHLHNLISATTRVKCR